LEVKRGVIPISVFSSQGNYVCPKKANESKVGFCKITLTVKRLQERQKEEFVMAGIKKELPGKICIMKEIADYRRILCTTVHNMRKRIKVRKSKEGCFTI
jgi:hypothetical protein